MGSYTQEACYEHLYVLATHAGTKGAGVAMMHPVEDEEIRLSSHGRLRAAHVLR
jgi:hypothetical protein